MMKSHIEFKTLLWRDIQFGVQPLIDY